METGCLNVTEAVYEGTFDTPKTEAGRRRIPLSDTVWALIDAWRPRAKSGEPDALIFATASGKPIAPNKTKAGRAQNRRVVIKLLA